MPPGNDGAQAAHVTGRSPQSQDRERVKDDVSACDRALHVSNSMHSRCQEPDRDSFMMLTQSRPTIACGSGRLSNQLSFDLTSYKVGVSRKMELSTMK